MKILYVDPGITHIGWAYGGPDDVPSYGTYKPPKTDRNLGWLMVDVSSFFTPLVKKNSIELVSYEAPVFVPGNNVMVIRKMFAIGGELERMAYLAGLPCEEQMPGPIRKYFLGRGNTPKHREDIKAAVIRQCHVLGWRPDSDDAADALAGLTYMLGIKHARVSKLMGQSV